MPGKKRGNYEIIHILLVVAIDDFGLYGENVRTCFYTAR